MKKIIFSAFLICTFSIFAQPILNASDINPLNISSNRFSSSSTTLGVGALGANVTWDFSSLVLTPQGANSNLSVATAPYSSSFPTANFFVNSITSGNNNFGYYNLTSSKLDVLGFSNSTGITVSYLNPSTAFQFPFSFNTSFTDTSQITGSSVVNTRTTTYDAYGTLTTAFGTYNNVIRLKRLENAVFASYTWITLNPYQEILTANAGSTINSFNYDVSLPTNLSATTNQLNNKFSIYPNPTSGILTIKNSIFSESETFVNVFDVLGNEIIKNDKVDNDSKNINLSDLSSGLYFIKITDANNAILYSDKIIKK